MGKPKSKGVGTEEGAEEEEEETGQPAGPPKADITDERRAQGGVAGSDPTPTPAPAPTPAPRKRGRPRKVVPKIEENTVLVPQQSVAMLATDAESKKPKAESPSSTRNGTPSNEQSSTCTKLSTRAPLRREGSRRKSEPRRAAD